jgi:hypothetical protein
MAVTLSKKYLNIGLVLEKYLNIAIWSIFKKLQLKNVFFLNRLLNFVESMTRFMSLTR